MTDTQHHSAPQHGSIVKVAGLDLHFHELVIGGHEPTGSQLAIAAGFTPRQEATVIQFLNDGGFEDIRPEETAKLSAGREFLIAESDRAFRLTIDGRRVDWPAPNITEHILRKLGSIGDNKAIYLEEQDRPDRKLEPGDVIDLAGLGVEAFHSRAATWVLNVQGVRLELTSPVIAVGDALIMAHFVPAEWRIYVKYTDQRREQVNPATILDLRQLAIDKIWLVPLDVTNGEASAKQRLDFALLEIDERFLDEHYAHWETIEDQGRRWLMIYGFHVPAGYTARRVTLALEVPTSYPVAQIDMFFAFPPLELETRRSIPNTEARQDIGKQSFQRWSRHRGELGKWSAERDNVITHLALVESSLRAEVA